MIEQRKRGRPALSEEEARRANVSFRTTPQVRDKIVAAAQTAGRSVAQEVELRLEQSFAREGEAGSRSTAILADFIRLAAGIIEAKTGKRWTEDADTFSRVSQAIRSFMAQNQPPPSAVKAELDETFAELRSLAAAMDEQQPILNALLARPSDPAIMKAHAESLRRIQEVFKRYEEAADLNKAAGKEAAETLGQIFQLRTKPAGGPQIAAAEESATAPRPRRLAKRFSQAKRPMAIARTTGRASE
jgi:hypothetical protein